MKMATVADPMRTVDPMEVNARDSVGVPSLPKLCERFAAFEPLQYMPHRPLALKIPRTDMAPLARR
jgi:hypothetical protein